MSRVQLTYGQIMDLRSEINIQMNQSLAFSLFHKEKISRFFQQNRVILSIIDRKLPALVKQYAIHDEKGEPVFIEKETGIKHYTFVDEETEKKYIDDVNAFTSIMNYIEI